eukprot:TCONS_00009665-protein
MDSAHGDDRNLAHSAAGRNPNKYEEGQQNQIVKLKEENKKEIQKLTYESKIALMESQMKIVNLEKDNQTLGHQLEMLKLKTVHEKDAQKGLADRELERKNAELAKKLSEMEKQLIVKGNEFKVKLAEKDHELVLKLAEKDNELVSKMAKKDKELVAKENEFKLKFKDLENENKVDIEKLRGEIEKLRTTKADNEQPKVNKVTNVPQIEIKKPQPNPFTEDEQFSWGLDMFFGRGGTWTKMVYDSYESWYQGITLLLKNKTPSKTYQRIDKEYFFIKKEFHQCHQKLCFKSYDPTRVLGRPQERDNEISTPIWLNKEIIRHFKVTLLHPRQQESCVKFGNPVRREPLFWWDVENVTVDFYFGEKRSAVLLVQYRRTQLTENDQN